MWIILRRADELLKPEKVGGATGRYATARGEGGGGRPLLLAPKCCSGHRACSAARLGRRGRRPQQQLRSAPPHGSNAVGQEQHARPHHHQQRQQPREAAAGCHDPSKRWSPPRWHDAAARDTGGRGERSPPPAGLRGCCLSRQITDDRCCCQATALETSSKEGPTPGKRGGAGEDLRGRLEVAATGRRPSLQENAPPRGSNRKNPPRPTSSFHSADDTPHRPTSPVSLQ